MGKILEVKHLNKKFGKKQILKDIDFSVEAGEICGFLGPNGAGKSTTIKLILGLLNRNQGKILINGYDVETDFEKALERVGSIIESPELYEFMSGMDNLKVFANMYKGITKSRINEVVKLVKLENRINEKVKRYSLGMKQRLGIAQALLQKPNLIILDEPTNGLDPVGIKELREMLRHLADHDGVAVLVSSHLLSEMELMCDRVCIIDKGEVITVKSMLDATSITENIKQTFLIKTGSTDLTEELIEASLDGKLKIDANQVEVSCTMLEMQKILKILVSNDIEIHSFGPKEKTLEDAFLEITDGSKSQIR